MRTLLLSFALSLCGMAQTFTITSPNVAQNLTIGPTAFAWTQGVSGGYVATGYSLMISQSGYNLSDVGSCNTGGSTFGCTITVNVTGHVYITLTGLGLPPSNSLVLYSGANFVAASAPTITAPAPGSVLSGSSATFSWNPGTATYLQFVLGDQYAGSTDIYICPGGLTPASCSVTGLPTDGRTIYGRLWYIQGGNTFSVDATYTAANALPPPTLSSTSSLAAGTSTPPPYNDYDPTLPAPPAVPGSTPVYSSIVTPAYGTPLTSGPNTFTWSPAGVPVYNISLSAQAYGGCDIVCLSQTSAQSVTATLPVGYVYFLETYAPCLGCASYSWGANYLVSAQGGQALLSTMKSVQTSQGKIQFRRGDQLDIGQLSYTFAPAASGWQYAYTLSSQELAAFRVGDRFDNGVTSETHPDGWLATATAWVPGKNPARSQAAQFTANSTFLPGPVAIYLQSDWRGLVAAFNGTEPLPGAGPLPLMAQSRDNVALLEQANIFNNSLRKFVIGPLFPADWTKDQVLKELGRWKIQLPFLAPLLNGGSVSDLQPSTQFETDVVNCVKGLTVLQ